MNFNPYWPVDRSALSNAIKNFHSLVFPLVACSTHFRKWEENFLAQQETSKFPNRPLGFSRGQAPKDPWVPKEIESDPELHERPPEDSRPTETPLSSSRQVSSSSQTPSPPSTPRPPTRYSEIQVELPERSLRRMRSLSRGESSQASLTIPVPPLSTQLPFSVEQPRSSSPFLLPERHSPPSPSLRTMSEPLTEDRIKAIVADAVAAAFARNISPQGPPGPTGPQGPAGVGNGNGNGHTGNASWRPEELGFFDPDLKDDSVGKGDIVYLETHPYYRNVFIFVERIRDVAKAKGENTVRLNLHSCLRGTALEWYSWKLTEFEKESLSKISLERGWTH